MFTSTVSSLSTKLPVGAIWVEEAGRIVAAVAVAAAATRIMQRNPQSFDASSWRSAFPCLMQRPYQAPVSGYLLGLRQWLRPCLRMVSWLDTNETTSRDREFRGAEPDTNEGKAMVSGRVPCPAGAPDIQASDARTHAPPLDWQLLSTGSYWRSPPCPVEVGSVPPRLLAFQHSCSAPTLLVRSAARTYPCSLIVRRNLLDQAIFVVRIAATIPSNKGGTGTRAAPCLASNASAKSL